MSILLYCVSTFDPPAELGVGVAQLPVLSMRQNEITVFYSSSPDPGVWTRDPLRQSAVEFHRVIESLFRRGAVIPFRFPTVLEDENAIAEHLKHGLPWYAEFLEKHKNDVQVEVTFTAIPEERDAAQSGTEYLRQRQRKAQILRSAVENLQRFAGAARERWRIRTLQSGVRAYALVPRESTTEFLENLRRFPCEDGLAFRVTGPWPVTEFLEEGHQQT